MTKKGNQKTENFFRRQKVIEKFWSAKFLSVLLNSAPSLRLCIRNFSVKPVSR